MPIHPSHTLCVCCSTASLHWPDQLACDSSLPSYQTLARLPPDTKAMQKKFQDLHLTSDLLPLCLEFVLYMVTVVVLPAITSRAD